VGVREFFIPIIFFAYDTHFLILYPGTGRKVYGNGGGNMQI
jgi:hypothetical protein